MKHFVPRTRIVCTLGPASTDKTVLFKMMKAGMDVARLNFSHGSHEEQLVRIGNIRELNRRHRRHIRLLGDLEGPRIRVGVLKDGAPIPLEKNRTVCFVREGEHDAAGIPFDYQGPLTDFRTAPFLYLDDGNLMLRLVDATRHRVRAKVVVGGLLKQRKALNAPGARLHFPPLSDKDREDIEFTVRNGLDFLALSFVRTARDVAVVREAIGGRLPDCRIVAKIENREGIRNLDSIIRAVDGIMIARGDMGVSLPIYEVPLIQKRIIALCRARRKLVITATQMLEHMVEYRTPTRAEATDIANAVLDGTDCVMLSAESAVGKYPVEAVAMMNQIIRHTELYGGRFAVQARRTK